MILLLILFFIIATAIAFVFFFGLGCFVIGSAPILDIVAVWIATIYFLYKPVASIAANFIVGFILNVIVWIVIIALYIGLLLFFQKFLNPLYRLFTLAISILGFFLGWALVLEIILHLFNVLAAGLHLVTFNFSSEPEAKVFLSNYIAPVFGDMNGIILFKFKIINQIINGIILILGSAFLYYVRIHALGEYTYTELILEGVNPFKAENITRKI